MAVKITKKQKRILDYISEYTTLHDVSPSYREIMSAMGLSSVSAVAEHISNLVKLGALKKVPGAARSLEIINLEHPETVDLFRLRLASATPEEVAILEKAAIILGIDI